MGKALRLTRRSRSNSLHGLSTYPYAPKIVHPRGKPLQRTCAVRCSGLCLLSTIPCCA